jgi:hypothetical protein
LAPKKYHALQIVTAAEAGQQDARNGVKMILHKPLSAPGDGR